MCAFVSTNRAAKIELNRIGGELLTIEIETTPRKVQNFSKSESGPLMNFDEIRVQNPATNS